MKFNTTKRLINMFFGKNPNERFRRFLILISTILVAIVLIQNVGCNYNKKDGFSFSWQPAAKIEVKK